jgi:hypothetical protein
MAEHHPGEAELYAAVIQKLSSFFDLSRLIGLLHMINALKPQQTTIAQVTVTFERLDQHELSITSHASAAGRLNVTAETIKLRIDDEMLRISEKYMDDENGRRIAAEMLDGRRPRGEVTP